MSDFIELTSTEEGKFLVKKSNIDIVFVGGEESSMVEGWEGDPCVVAIINGIPTKVLETYQEVKDELL